MNYAVSASPGHELRMGWPLILASMAGHSLGLVSFYTLGVFVEPLQEEFGWSRSLVTSGLTISAIVCLILAGPVGYLIDRIGPRRVALFGTVIFCLVFAAFSMVTGGKLNWWMHWVVLAIGISLVNATVWTKAIVSRFDAARGIATSLALCGAGITGMAGPVIGNHLIEAYGWRTAYVGIAGAWFVVCMPLIFALFFSAQDRERATRRRQKAQAAVQEIPLRVKEEGLSIAVAVRSLVFLKLSVASFLIVALVTATIVHLMPMLSESGMDRQSAAAIVGVVGIAALAGRITTGSLLDRFHGPFVGAGVSCFPALAFGLLLVFDGGYQQAILIAVLLGVTSGAEVEMAAYFSSRFFGKANFGALFGFIIGLVTLGAGVGPMIAGIAFDTFGTYEPALLAAIPLCLMSAGLILSLGRYPESFEQSETPGAGLATGS